MAALIRCVLCRMANGVRPSPPQSPGEFDGVAVPPELGQFARTDGSAGVHFQILPCYLAFAIAAAVALTLRM